MAKAVGIDLGTTNSGIAVIRGIETEIIKNNALVQGIKSFDGRMNAEDNDTFVVSDSWRCNSAELLLCGCV